MPLWNVILDTIERCASTLFVVPNERPHNNFTHCSFSVGDTVGSGMSNVGWVHSLIKPDASSSFDGKDSSMAWLRESWKDKIETTNEEEVHHAGLCQWEMC